MRRRMLLVGSLGLCWAIATGCGGAGSTLHALGEPKGTGPIDFQIENRTDDVINSLYLAPTREVRAASEAAFESGTAEQTTLWGDDLLVGSALESGGKIPVRVPQPGQYDVRAVGRDGLEQHVAGLTLRAGGRYVLELNDGSWRRPK